MTNEEKAREIASVLVAEDKVQQPLIDLLTTAMYWALSHQWISVEDELPPKRNGGDYSDRVIIITEPLTISASCYDYEKHRWLCGYAVTHWMPIPQLTEKGGNNK